MQDLGLHGVESCRCQRYRHQTPRNLLIYRTPFGNDERVTDSHAIRKRCRVYESEYLGAFEGDESRESRVIL